MGKEGNIKADKILKIYCAVLGQGSCKEEWPWWFSPSSSIPCWCCWSWVMAEGKRTNCHQWWLWQRWGQCTGMKYIHIHDVLVLFVCSFANSYILFSSSRHCWPNMLPSCQTWELMELKSMDYENKVKTARSVLWSRFLLDCKFNSASWDIDLPFSSVLRMPMIFFRWKKVVFLLMS